MSGAPSHKRHEINKPTMASGVQLASGGDFHGENVGMLWGWGFVRRGGGSEGVILHRKMSEKDCAGAYLDAPAGLQVIQLL